MTLSGRPLNRRETGECHVELASIKTRTKLSPVGRN